MPDFNPVNQYDIPAEMSSTFLELPFNAAMQAAQEINRQNELGRQRAEELNILGKNIKALEWDKPIVHQKRQSIYNTVDDLINQRDFRSREYNDRLFKARRDIQNEINYGELGAAQQRYDEYYKEVDRINKDVKEPVKRAYMIKQLEDINSKDPLKYNPNTGQYNHLKPVHDWEHKNINKTISEYGKDLEADTSIWQGRYKNVDDFYKEAASGTVESLARQKILERLAGAYSGDPDLQMSGAALSTYHNYGDPQQEYNAIIPVKGEDGKIYLDTNKNSVIGWAIEGYIQGKAYRKENIDFRGHENYAAKKQLDYSIDHPLNPWGTYAPTFDPTQATDTQLNQSLGKWFDKGYFSFENGKLVPTTKESKGLVFNIDGKNYDSRKDDLPDGYFYDVSFGGDVIVKGPGNKRIEGKKPIDSSSGAHAANRASEVIRYLKTIGLYDYKKDAQTNYKESIKIDSNQISTNSSSKKHQ
jgi:hypothetical protein